MCTKFGLNAHTTWFSVLFQQDLKQATEALNRLQGFVLLSSDRGGIRIEYAKNKMGEVVSLPI